MAAKKTDGGGGGVGAVAGRNESGEIGAAGDGVSLEGYYASLCKLDHNLITCCFFLYFCLCVCWGTKNIAQLLLSDFFFF